MESSSGWSGAAMNVCIIVAIFMAARLAARGLRSRDDPSRELWPSRERPYESLDNLRVTRSTPMVSQPASPPSLFINRDSSSTILSSFFSNPCEDLEASRPPRMFSISRSFALLGFAAMPVERSSSASLSSTRSPRWWAQMLCALSPSRWNAADCFGSEQTVLSTRSWRNFDRLETDSRTSSGHSPRSPPCSSHRRSTMAWLPYTWSKASTADLTTPWRPRVS
mmetsp:Transcript_2439/g.7527  ORF Transcript_2439/g.7527 Transcript_2439/m.7527 type:complete len:223 (-) Transcript_2439:1174-1842(-)